MRDSDGGYKYHRSRRSVEVRNRSVQVLRDIAASTPERQLREAEMLLRESRVRLSGDQQALLNLGLPLRLEELAGLPDEEVARRLARLGLPDEIVARAGPGALPADLLPMYAPFDVPRLLGRPLEVSLTRDSGLAGLVFVIRQHTGRELAKDDPALLRAHAEITRQFDAGRQTAVEWEELARLLDSRAVAAG